MKNDYRDYIVHSAFHKYISRKRGKNGEWQYVYPGLGTTYSTINDKKEKKKDNFITRIADTSKVNHKKEHAADREASKRRRKKIDPFINDVSSVVSDTFGNVRKASIYKKQDKKRKAKQFVNSGKNVIGDAWNEMKNRGTASSERGKNTVNAILPGAIKKPHASDVYKKNKKRERIARRAERNRSR